MVVQDERNRAMAKHSRLVGAFNDNVAPLLPKCVEPSIDLLQAKMVQFDMYVLGGVHKGVELNVIIKDTSGKKAKTLGALRVTPKQWDQLKRDGDRILGAHHKLLKR